MVLPLAMMKKLLIGAAMRAVNDPRVQAKAMELAQKTAPQVAAAARKAGEEGVAAARQVKAKAVSAGQSALRTLRRRPEAE